MLAVSAVSAVAAVTLGPRPMLAIVMQAVICAVIDTAIDNAIISKGKIVVGTKVVDVVTAGMVVDAPPNFADTTYWLWSNSPVTKRLSDADRSCESSDSFMQCT